MQGYDTNYIDERLSVLLEAGYYASDIDFKLTEKCQKKLPKKDPAAYAAYLKATRPDTPEPDRIKPEKLIRSYGDYTHSFRIKGKVPSGYRGFGWLDLAGPVYMIDTIMPSASAPTH
jgi:hypothetical protein